MDACMITCHRSAVYRHEHAYIRTYMHPQSVCLPHTRATPPSVLPYFHVSCMKSHHTCMACRTRLNSSSNQPLTHILSIQTSHSRIISLNISASLVKSSLPWLAAVASTPSRGASADSSSSTGASTGGLPRYTTVPDGTALSWVDVCILRFLSFILWYFFVVL